MSERPSEHLHVAHALQGYRSLSDDNKRLSDFGYLTRSAGGLKFHRVRRQEARNVILPGDSADFNRGYEHLSLDHKRLIGSYLAGIKSGLEYRLVAREEARGVRICPSPPQAFWQYLKLGSGVLSETCPPPHAQFIKWYQNPERTACYRLVDNFARLAVDANDIAFILDCPPIGADVIYARTEDMIDAVVQRGCCELPLVMKLGTEEVRRAHSQTTAMNLNLLLRFVERLYDSGQLAPSRDFQGVTALLFMIVRPHRRPGQLYPENLRRFWFDLTEFVVSKPEFNPHMRSTSKENTIRSALGRTPREFAQALRRPDLVAVFHHFGVF